ncbi:MAG: hypothetical protein ACI8ZN_001483 [Bacteroidia bacterium]|jgi:hypothetical protein
MNKFVHTLFIILLSFGSGSAQVWQPINKGLSHTPSAITSAGEKIAVAYTIGAKGTEKYFEVAVWNGFSWDVLPSIVCDSGSHITSLQFYESALYIAGSFKSFNKLTKPQNIVKWENSTFKVLPSLTATTPNNREGISSLGIYNKLLMVTGSFSNDVVSTGSNLSFFNGSIWVPSGISALGPLNGAVSSAVVVKSTLFIGGSFTKVGATTTKYLASFPPLKVLSFENNTVIPEKIVAFDTALVLYGVQDNDKNRVQHFHKIHNDSVIEMMEGISKIDRIYDLVSVGKTLYASGVFILDGNDDEQYIIAYSDGKWVALGAANLPGIRNLTQYRTTLVGSGFFASFNKVTLNRVAVLRNIEGAVFGKVYFDKNSNCSFDPREEPLVNQTILITPGNKIIRPNDEGNFLVFLEKGVYTFTLFPGKYYSIAPCDQLVKKVEIDDATFLDTVNYALLQKSNVNDLSVKLTSNAGALILNKSVQSYFITYENKGTKDVNVVRVGLKFDGKLKNLVADPKPAGIVGDSVFWEFENLYSGLAGKIFCKFELSASSQLGDQLQLDADIFDPDQEDADQANNRSSLTQTVEENVESVSKQVFPNINSKDTSYFPIDLDHVDFQISFSNHGSDTVHTVHVIDTIYNNEYLRGISETGASHKYSYNLIPGGKEDDFQVVVWTFSNINLIPNPSKNPEVVSDDGHIAFNLDLKNSFPIGSVFSNRAHVVFDYGEKQPTQEVFAIATKTSSIIAARDGLKPAIWVFPNPASNHLNVGLQNAAHYNYAVYDLQGSTLLFGDSEDGNSINIGTLVNGTYFLLITSDDGVYCKKFIKIIQ